jgi:hypothetical protein
MKTLVQRMIEEESTWTESTIESVENNLSVYEIIGEIFGTVKLYLEEGGRIEDLTEDSNTIYTAEKSGMDYMYCQIAEEIFQAIQTMKGSDMTREELLRKREEMDKYIDRHQACIDKKRRELEELNQQLAGLEKKNYRVIRGAVMIDEDRLDYCKIIHGTIFNCPMDYETFCCTLASCSGEPMNWFAMDEDFVLYWYNGKPEKFDLNWDTADDGNYDQVMNLREFPALLPPGGWENSLVQTQEVED